MWLCRHKYLADDTLSRYKARLMTNGSTQLEEGDLSKTVYTHQPLGFRDSVQHNYIIASLHQEFSMTDHGPLNYFLGIFVTRDSSRVFLSQRKYAIEIFEMAHMVTCNPCRTPGYTESKLGDDGD
nr:ribonuclease H-like domain-containing protein [Tanacetum cinerariifolium]